MESEKGECGREKMLAQAVASLQSVMLVACVGLHNTCNALYVQTCETCLQDLQEVSARDTDLLLIALCDCTDQKQA